MKSFFSSFYLKDNFHFFASLNLDVLEVIVLWSTWSQVELCHLWKSTRLQPMEMNSAVNSIIKQQQPTTTLRLENGTTPRNRENHRICKHNHIFCDFVLVLVKKHFGSMGCPTFSHLAPKNSNFIHSKGLPVWSLCRWWGPSRGRLWHEVPHLCWTQGSSREAASMYKDIKSLESRSCEGHIGAPAQFRGPRGVTAVGRHLLQGPVHSMQIWFLFFKMMK